MAAKKQKSIAKLADDCAVLLQKLVRMKAASSLGYVTCSTCNKSGHWKEMQGGHFIERGRLATKLVEENVHPQCPGCNQFKMKTASGVLEYLEFMVNTYGPEFVNELQRMSKQAKKFTRLELAEIKADFQAQISIQEQRISA